MTISSNIAKFMEQASPFIDISELKKMNLSAFTDGEDGNYKYIRLTSKDTVVYEMNFVDNKEFNGCANLPDTKYTLKNGSLDGSIDTSLYKGNFENGKFNGKLYVLDLPDNEFHPIDSVKRHVSDECYYTYKDNVLSGESTGEYEGIWNNGKFTGKHYRSNEYFEDGVYCNDGYHSYEQIVDGKIAAQCSDGYGYMWHREIYLPINGECRIIDDDGQGNNKKTLALFSHKGGKKDGDFIYHISIDSFENGVAIQPSENYMVKGTHKDNQIEGKVVHYWKENPFLEENYHLGSLDGKRIMYNKPDRIEYESSALGDIEGPCIENFDHGKLDGEQLYFYDQVNGQVKRKDYYKNGEKEYSLEYTPNNVLMRKSEYKNGKLSDVYEYSHDGKILEHTVYEEGQKRLHIKYTPDGRQSETHHYDKDGKDDTRMYLAKKKVAQWQTVKSEKLKEKGIQVKNADGTTRNKTVVEKLNPIMKAWKLHKALKEVDAGK